MNLNLNSSSILMKGMTYVMDFATTRAPTTLKSEGEVTSLSGVDKREVRDNKEKW